LVSQIRLERAEVSGFRRRGPGAPAGATPCGLSSAAVPSRQSRKSGGEVPPDSCRARASHSVAERQAAISFRHRLYFTNREIIPKPPSQTQAVLGRRSWGVFLRLVCAWDEDSVTSPKAGPWSRSPAEPFTAASSSGPVRSSTTSSSSDAPSVFTKFAAVLFPSCPIITYVQLRISNVMWSARLCGVGSWLPFGAGVDGLLLRITDDLLQEVIMNEAKKEKLAWSPGSQRIYTRRTIERARSENRPILRAFADWLAKDRRLNPGTITVRLGSTCSFVDALTACTGRS
jgi:hypothetical protein